MLNNENGTSVASDPDAFYSSFQDSNRATTQLIVETFMSTRRDNKAILHVADVCSGIGIRGIQYCRSNSHVHVTSIDISYQNCKLIEKNFSNNFINSSRYTVICADGIRELEKIENKDRFDIIDVDPFGSATSMIIPCLHSVADGGLICLTYSDANALFGSRKADTFSHYGIHLRPTKGVILNIQ